MIEKMDYENEILTLGGSVRLGTFSKWEQGFIDDIKERFDNDEDITEKQYDKLKEIYSQYYD